MALVVAVVCLAGFAVAGRVSVRGPFDWLLPFSETSAVNSSRSGMVSSVSTGTKKYSVSVAVVLEQ